MKIIFLDHDGVICLSSNWGSRHIKSRKWREHNKECDISLIPIHLTFDTFDKKSVKILNRILEKTGADIVVSSDWRLYTDLEGLQEIYRQNGVIKIPIGITPKLKDFDESTYDLFCWKGLQENIRCLEIERYLEENKNEIETWVAVDDLNMSHNFLNPGLERFVLTPLSHEGIKQTGIEEKIIKFLSTDQVY